MALKSLRCQGCGSSLSIEEGIRYITCNYCQCSLEIVSADDHSYSKMIDKIAADTGRLAASVEKLALEKELERIDRVWADHLQGYYCEASTYSSKVYQLSAFLLLAGFGGVVLAMSERSWPILPLSLFVVAGAIWKLYRDTKLYRAYREELSWTKYKYVEHRKELLRQIAVLS